MANQSKDDAASSKEGMVDLEDMAGGEDGIDLSKEFSCPICLMVITRTRTVMECLHRFCGECIDKAMRIGNNECPVCRIHLPSRRALRDDPKFDKLISRFYPHVENAAQEAAVFDRRMKELAKSQQEDRIRIQERQAAALGKRQRVEVAPGGTGSEPSTGLERAGPSQQLPPGDAEPEESPPPTQIQTQSRASRGGREREGSSSPEEATPDSLPEEHEGDLKVAEMDRHFWEQETKKARLMAEVKAKEEDLKLSASGRLFLRTHGEFNASIKSTRIMSVRVALWPLFNARTAPKYELPWLVKPYHHFHSHEFVLSIKNHIAGEIDLNVDRFEIFLGSRHPLGVDELMAKLAAEQVAEFARDEAVVRCELSSEEDKAGTPPQQSDAVASSADCGALPNKEGAVAGSADGGALHNKEVRVVPEWPSCFEAVGWAEECTRMVDAFEGSRHKRKTGPLQLIPLWQSGLRIGTVWDDLFDKNSHHMAVYYRLKEGQSANGGALAGIMKWACDDSEKLSERPFES